MTKGIFEDKIPCRKISVPKRAAFYFMKYKIIFSHPDIEKFVESLPTIACAKVIRMLELLARFGYELKMPHVKKLPNGLFELRVRGKQEIRFFYYFESSDLVIVLHGFKKKTQKIPAREFAIARKRKKNIII